MMTPSATVHLVCGSTGAGKTTLSQTLAQAHDALVFSIDEWMVALFAVDMPTPPDWNWIGERVTRCETRIITLAKALGARSVSSVLDIGLLRAERRTAVRAELEAEGLTVRLHYLDVAAQERWRRVDARNRAPGASFHMTVSRQMFDFIETLWQPPTPAELVA